MLHTFKHRAKALRPIQPGTALPDPLQANIAAFNESLRKLQVRLMDGLPDAEAAPNIERWIIRLEKTRLDLLDLTGPAGNTPPAF